MNESTVNTVVAAYVGAVRDELAGLTPEDRADLMEDVSEHVAAVAAEYDDLTMGVLVDRLGAPASFAAELREAAGLPEVGETTPAAESGQQDGFFRRLGRFIAVVLALVAVVLVATATVGRLPGNLLAAAIAAAAVGGVVALLVRGGRNWKDEVEMMPGAPQLRRGRVWFAEQTWSDDLVDFVVSLRPAWWVARGVAVAFALGYLARSVPVALWLTLPLTLVSVWLGRRSRGERSPGRRVVEIAANGALVLTTLGVALAVVDRVDNPWVYVDSDPYQEVYVESTGYYEAGPESDGMVYRDDGTLVTNLFPYGPDGQLLEGVRLYDQDGRPFELGLADGCEEWGEPGWLYLPHGDPKNAFPHRLIEAEPDTGECLEPVTVPPFGPFLPGSPVTETMPEPTPEPTPVPTPGPTVVPTSEPTGGAPG